MISLTPVTFLGPLNNPSLVSSTAMNLLFFSSIKIHPKSPNILVGSNDFKFS